MRYSMWSVALARPVLWILTVLVPVAAAAGPPPGPPPEAEEAVGLAAFRAAFDEPVRPWIVELEGRPGYRARLSPRAHAAGLEPVEAITRNARESFALQDAALDRFAALGGHLLLRTREIEQPDGSRHRIEYRFHYLLNGFVAYLPDSEVERLRALPGVARVTEPARGRFFLADSVDYFLGSDPILAVRRLDVYGVEEELGPLASGDPQHDPQHPEETDWNALDGFEGQGMYLAVVDSGLEYTHPMFGGSGSILTTPLPQLGGAAGAPPSADDNRKVVYFYNLGGAATLDDFGHGTHVASTAAGYRVDGSTVAGTPGSPGAPPGGATIHGVAPQAKMLAYPVCDVSGGCAGDIELAIEDAASPVSLLGMGDGGSIPTATPKPVADVINLSLGGGNSPDSSTSRVSNNAVLAGVTVVAAAGNDGPGAQTLGAPCVGTLVTCVAAVQDPGSIAGADVLAGGSIVGDTCAGTTDCAVPGPPEETGAPSDANLAGPGPQGIKLFPMAGGGEIPSGSLSGHYVYVDRDEATVPVAVGNRVALLQGGTGTFFQIVNPVAVNAPPPAAILLITETTSATAVAVVNGVPTFTVSPDDGAELLDLMLTGDDDGADPPHGTVSELPLRVKRSVAVASFDGAMGDFSSRGPNAAPAARYRTVKPDVAAPGVGVLAATTTTGNPDDAVGMANPSGYTSASGTSMATPHASGAALLARQYLRTLGFDSTDPLALDYLDLRLEAALLTRALLMNNATNLRSGLGAADPDPAPESLNDMGAGLVDVAALLAADAVLWGPVTLFDEEPDEYTPFAEIAAGDLEVMIPSHSFGNVVVVGVDAEVESLHEVTIRDISTVAAGNPGGGTYDLAVLDNRLPASGFTVDFTDLSGTPISSIAVPAGGEASFRVRVRADGNQLAVDGQQIQWYVSAEHQATAKRLRMPFYYRAVEPELTEAVAPDLAPPADTEVATSPCPTDTDGAFTLEWSYTPPSAAAPLPVGYRVQQGSFSDLVFDDDADEPLVAGANSRWAGSAQWTSQVNPESGSLAYFVPDAAEQDESLSMTPAVTLPAGGASLSFLTNQDTEAGFDFLFVEISVDGGSFQTLGAFSGAYVGPRTFDISPFAGGDVQVRFRMQSDLVVSAPGVYVEDVEIRSDDFATIAQLGPAATTKPVVTPAEGDHLFRVLGLFDTPAGDAPGPVSESRCVTVDLACAGDVLLSSQTISEDAVFTACVTLTAAPDVVIETGTEVHFVAGQRIVLGDGFRVGAGARFTAGVNPVLLP